MKAALCGIVITTLAFASTARALDQNGAGEKHQSLRALYLFDETSGDIVDSSGVTPQLNLEVTDPDAVLRENGYLNIKRDTLIRSKTAATKITNACSSSDAMTIEMWIENNRSALPPENFGDPIPLTVVGLGTATNEQLQFSQFYDNGDVYRLESNFANLQTDTNIAAVGKLQHIYLTRSGGTSKIYVGDTTRTLPRVSSSNGAGINLSDDAILTLGNMPDYNPNAPVTERFSWKGRIHLLAIYCEGFTEEYILGDLLPKTAYDSIVPLVSGTITDYHTKAADLHKRLTGVKTPIDNPIIDEMAQKLAQGDTKGAAELATTEAGFYNITVRDFASRMSTRDETVNAGLNDLVATVIGVARDDVSAKELLTGNFYYAADPAKSAVDTDLVDDFLKSNNHYEQLDQFGYDLSSVLMRYNGQKLYNGRGGVVDNPDPAGILTSRAFMSAHAVAGTNRRLVEFTFREFLCVPMEKWADYTGPDAMIGRDVDRFPAGDHDRFKTTCRSCHSNMDGLRGAFARFTFSAGFVKNAVIIPAGPGEDDESTMKQDPMGIAAKYNHNDHVFPGGHETTTTDFVNYATRGANAAYFGWSDQLSGKGVQEFGKMISEAKAFPRCMAQRAFRAVCKREPASFDMPMIERVSQEFANNGYKLRDLFERIAITPECLGK